MCPCRSKLRNPMKGRRNHATFWKLFQRRSGKGSLIMMSGILDAFLDGFTGAGLWEKVRLPGPPTTYRQAMIALTCGCAASFMMIIGLADCENSLVCIYIDDIS